MKKIDEVKVAFYGTSEFSLLFLQDLVKSNVKVSYVVSQPPRKAGRGKKIKLSAVHEWSKINNLKVYTPKKTSDPDFFKEISNIEIDFNIVVAYGNILTKDVINLPNFLSINVHASMLPRWRGAAPIQRAILSDDKRTGVCIMRVDEKLDSGPIILDKDFNIEADDNFKTIYNKVIMFGQEILKESVIKVINNNVKFKFQNNKFVTYAKKIKKSECKIDWNNNAHDVNLKIRAFSPFPGAWTSFKDSKLRIKILKAKVIPQNKIFKSTQYKVGEITENLEVKCAKDFLKIDILQKEGKTPINAKDFLNSKTIENFFL